MCEWELLERLQVVSRRVWEALVGLAHWKGKEPAEECLAACLLAAAEGSTDEDFSTSEMVLATIAHHVESLLRLKSSR